MMPRRQRRATVMIYEERNYLFQVAHFSEFLGLFEQEGLPIMQSHLGKLVAYFITETGELNTAVHIWAYSSFEDRLKRREALWADPAWVHYAAKVTPWILRMESRLLRPTSFSPLQ